jgi:hypothetical protein
LPDTDKVVGVASKQSLSVCGPGEGDALWSLGLRVGGENLLSQLIHYNLAFKILKIVTTLSNLQS